MVKTYIIPCIVFMLLLITGSAFAATRYSIGNGTNWTDPASWSATLGGPSCGCVPGPSDIVHIRTNIILNVHLTGGSGISGTLNIAAGASLYTTGFDIEIKNGGSLTVNGQLDCRDLTFANGSNVYVGSNGVVNVHRNFSNNNNSDQVVVDGQLNIYGSAYNGNGGNISGSGSINPYGSPFTGSGTFTGVAVLPIELLAFTVTMKDNNRAEIYWVTGSERNNDHFTIERSRDGDRFETVAIVDGAGSSLSMKEYMQTDEHPYPGTSYYRIKQTDFNGSFSYSPLAALDNTGGKLTFELFPNPVTSNMLNLSISAPSNEEVLVVVNDLFGREYYSKVIVVEDGRYKLVVDPSEKLQPGVYSVIASSHNNRLYSQKVVVR